MSAEKRPAVQTYSSLDSALSRKPAWRRDILRPLKEWLAASGERERRRRSTVLLTMAGLLVGLCMAGADIWLKPMLAFGHADFVVTIVRELGMALMISAVLALTLERWLIREVTEDVASGVEAYFLTHGLPPAFAEEVIFIRDIRMYRLDYKLELTFRVTPEDRILLETKSSYKVVNASRGRAPFKHRAHSAVEETRAERMSITRVVRRGKDLSADDLYDGPPPSPEAFEQVVYLPPHRDAGAADNSFEYRTSQVYFDNDGEHSLIFLDPALNVTVEVEPNGLVDVDVTLGHHDEDECEVSPLPPARPAYWKLSRAFLPYSCVLITWKRKEPPHKLGGGSRASQEGHTDGPPARFTP